MKEKNPGFHHFSLIDLALNDSAIISGVRAGKDANKRLSELGLTPGTKIKKLSSAPFHGPIQLEVRNTRLVIGRGLASKILLKN